MDQEGKFEVKIYESSKELTEIGAGVNFWSRTWEIFKAIGLDEKLEKILVESPPDPQSMRKLDIYIFFWVFSCALRVN